MKSGSVVWAWFLVQESVMGEGVEHVNATDLATEDLEDMLGDEALPAEDDMDAILKLVDEAPEVTRVYYAFSLHTTKQQYIRIYIYIYIYIYISKYITLSPNRLWLFR
jgi:hypothetical protein